MEIIIGVILALVITALVFLYLFIEKKKYIKNIKEQLKEIGEVTLSNNKAYDVSLKINDKEIYVKFLYLGGHKDLSINSPAHFEVKFRGKSTMFKTGGFENIKEDKALLVFPPPNRILKYINENEVVFVKYEEKCFDFYLFTSDEIDKIEEVFK